MKGNVQSKGNFRFLYQHPLTKSLIPVTFIHFPNTTICSGKQHETLLEWRDLTIFVPTSWQLKFFTTFFPRPSDDPLRTLQHLLFLFSWRWTTIIQVEEMKTPKKIIIISLARPSKGSFNFWWSFRFFIRKLEKFLSKISPQSVISLSAVCRVIDSWWVWVWIVSLATLFAGYEGWLKMILEILLNISLEIKLSESLKIFV